MDKTKKPVKNLADLVRVKTQTEVLYDRGVGHAREGYYEMAIVDFSEALKIGRDFAKPYVFRGVLYTFGKNYKKAVADFESARKIDGTVDEIFESLRRRIG